MNPVTCAEINERLYEYVEGELEITFRVQCEVHVGECPPCKVVVESYRATITFARALPKCSKPLNPGFEAKLRAMLG